MGVGVHKRARAAAGFVAVAALAAGLLVEPAAAAGSCSYDSGSKTVTATVDAGTQATLKVVGGALHFGEPATACGAATTSNTDSITITGNAGTNETLVLDHRGGVFGPGFTLEFNEDEIEIATSLGDATDTVIVYATEDPDFMAAGQFGLALNTDGDVDVTFAPNTFKLEMHMLGGDDFFNGRGQGGAGLHFLGPIVITGGEGNESLLRGGSDPDIIDGGPGNDRIESQEGADTVDGGPGNDYIAGGDHNDVLTGGSGADSFSASGGDDIIHAEDDEADTLINGGSEVDTAYFDEGLDPDPVAVENEIGDGGPPPPPPGPCAYNATTKAVTTTMAAGSAATLKVVSGAIWFGTTPAACGVATTANTNSISIGGSAGTVETLAVDMSGGAFEPGFSSESSGISEIEITTTLGDATDVVTVYGTTGADTIRIGQNGIGLNADSDRDLTFSALPAQLEVFGLGGANVLWAKGGSGTGSSYLGVATLHAGDAGDTVTGGSGADVLYGGSGNDTMDGSSGDDIIDGAGGNDSLNGGNGNDQLTGGSGADTFTGGNNNDILHADDDEADVSISGGGGSDTAYYDLGIDPNPVAETKIAA